MWRQVDAASHRFLDRCSAFEPLRDEEALRVAQIADRVWQTEHIAVNLEMNRRLIVSSGNKNAAAGIDL